MNGAQQFDLVVIGSDLEGQKGAVQGAKLRERNDLGSNPG